MPQSWVFNFFQAGFIWSCCHRNTSPSGSNLQKQEQMVLLWLCSQLLSSFSLCCNTHLPQSNKSVPYVHFHPITRIAHTQSFIYIETMAIQHLRSPGETNHVDSHTDTSHLPLTVKVKAPAVTCFSDMSKRDNWNRRADPKRRMLPPEWRPATVRIRLSLACESSTGQTLCGKSFEGLRSWSGTQLKCHLPWMANHNTMKVGLEKRWTKESSNATQENQWTSTPYHQFLHVVSILLSVDLYNDFFCERVALPLTLTGLYL